MNELVAPEVLASKFGQNVSRRKVIEWAHRYGWPHVRVGRTIAFTAEDVEQIIANHKVAGTKDLLPTRLPGQTARSAAASARAS